MNDQPIKIPSSWRFVVYQSIYSDEEGRGFLQPNGDIVDWFSGIIPAGWKVLASRDEVKRIVSYLDTPTELPARPNFLQQASDRLLPCPFCGNEAIMTPVGNGHYKAKCTVCSASVVEDRIDKAEGMWNCRHVDGNPPIDL